MEQTELQIEYFALVDEAVEMLGSERKVDQALGFGGHGLIAYRRTHPLSVRREHIMAMESLIRLLKASRPV